MGLTERHWFEDEEPELTENQLEDILWENNKIFERGYQKGFSDGKSAILREPAKPREERHEVRINHVWGDEIEVWSEFYCPHCGEMIAKGNSEHYPRCMWCGNEVKWE